MTPIERPDTEGWSSAETAVLDALIAAPGRVHSVPAKLKTYSQIRAWALRVGRIESCKERTNPGLKSSGRITVCYCPASVRASCPGIAEAEALLAEWDALVARIAATVESSGAERSEGGGGQVGVGVPPGVWQ